MPELPEVETMRRGIASVVGLKIKSIASAVSSRRPISIRPPLEQIDRRLAGQKIASVDRLGKRIVLRAESGDRLIIEPRMTGLVLTGPPPTREHLRIVIRLQGRGAPVVRFWDQRGLGVVTLLSPVEYEEQFSNGKIGPDACEITIAEFRQNAGSSRSAIKPVLLDQSRVAGIGNLYASEILYWSRIDPRVPANRLNASQWQRLHRALRAVLKKAIRLEGSTLSDGTYRNSLNQAGGYQNHCVYGRAGANCLRCGKQSRVVRIVQAQRSTFWCPRCQKER